MCGSDYEPGLAAFTQNDCNRLKQMSSLDGGLIQRIFEACTYKLSTALNVVPTIVTLIEQFKAGKFGLFKSLQASRVPFSIVSGTVRFQTQIVHMIHEGFLPFAMAQKNIQMLDKVLEEEGMRLVRGCCCGLFLTEAGNMIEDTELFQDTDQYRSAINWGGYELRHVVRFDEIPKTNVDLSQDEQETLETIERRVNVLKEYKHQRELLTPEQSAAGQRLFANAAKVNMASSATRSA